MTRFVRKIQVKPTSHHQHGKCSFARAIVPRSHSQTCCPVIRKVPARSRIVLGTQYSMSSSKNVNAGSGSGAGAGAHAAGDTAPLRWEVESSFATLCGFASRRVTVEALAVRPCSTEPIAVVGQGSVAYALNADTGKVIARLQQPSAVSSVAFSADGRVVAIACSSAVQVHTCGGDWTELAVVKSGGHATTEGEPSRTILSASVSADGRRLAVLVAERLGGMLSQPVMLLDLSSCGNPLELSLADSSPVLDDDRERSQLEGVCISFSPADNNLLAVAGTHADLLCVDVSTAPGRVCNRFVDHRDTKLWHVHLQAGFQSRKVLAFSPSGDRLAWCGDNVLRTMEVRGRGSGASVRLLMERTVSDFGSSYPVSSASFSAAHPLVVCGSLAHDSCVIPLHGGDEIALRLRSEYSAVTGVGFLPDRQNTIRFVACLKNGAIIVWAAVKPVRLYFACVYRR